MGEHALRRAQTWLAGLINTLASRMRQCVKFCLAWLIIGSNQRPVHHGPLSERLNPLLTTLRIRHSPWRHPTDHLSPRLGCCTPLKPKTPRNVTPVNWQVDACPSLTLRFLFVFAEPCMKCHFMQCWQMLLKTVQHPLSIGQGRRCHD